MCRWRRWLTDSVGTRFLRWRVNSLLRSQHSLRLVLIYHNVGHVAADRGTLPPNQFRSQMGVLRQGGFQCMSLDELLQKKVDEPGRFFAITFDDARDGVHRWALPILQELGLNATLFVPTALVGTERAFSYCTSPIGPVTPGEVRETHGFLTYYMSWDDIRSWRDAGQHVGSHGINHTHFSELPTEWLEWELRESRTELLRQLGEAVRLLAYPYGANNERVRNVAARYYEAAVTTVPAAYTGGESLFQVPRIGPGNREFEFLLQLYRLLQPKDRG